MMLRNIHVEMRRSSGLLTRPRSKAFCVGWMCLFRSLIRMMQIMFTAAVQIAVMRKAHATLMLEIMASVDKLYIKPPMPLPAAAIPFAMPFLRANHWGIMPMVPMYKKEQPQPKSNPCDRKSCHDCFAKLAPIRAPASITAPTTRGGFVPNTRVACVTRGAMRRIWDWERPPMKEYAISEVPGKAFVEM
jgi:hypothetical protein